VDVRWSSTLLMVERALILRMVCVVVIFILSSRMMVNFAGHREVFGSQRYGGVA
jgi:hypothetical protein